SASTTGVLPVPPTLILPTITTGTGEGFCCWLCWRRRRRASTVKRAASGRSRCSQAARLYQASASAISCALLQLFLPQSQGFPETACGADAHSAGSAPATADGCRIQQSDRDP